jgi:hypothetical protein
MIDHKEAIKLDLIVPTVFADYNAKNNLDKNKETTSLSIQRMKHKHFRQMQSMPEEKQIHYIMSQLTMLSENDLDELDIEDSARLSEVILGFMRHYANLAKKMMEAK